MSRRNQPSSSGPRARPAPPSPAAPGWKPLSTNLAGAALALITLGLFAPVCGFDFVNYDDLLFVTRNPHLREGFTGANLVWAFSNHDAYLWHPLTWLSHLLDYQCYGLKPGGHHLTNILIHAAATVMLFLVLRRMTGAPWRSIIVAALFAWHPLHVQSVAWVAERKDVLSGFFWMLTLWSYVRYVEQPGRGRYAQLLAWFLLGLMCKPMGVTLPCVLLLLDVWPLQRIKFGAAENGGRLPWREFGRLVREKIPLFVAAIVISVVTIRAIKDSDALISTTAVPPGYRVANALTSYAAYLGEIFWPVNLAVFYPLPPGWTAWEIAGAALLLAGITVLAVRARRHGYLLMGWLWFLGTLFPVIGLVQNGNQSMADRYTYLPYIGVFIALVWGAAELAARRPALLNPVRFAAIIVLVGCLAGTSLQLPFWRNSEVLFRRALEVTRDNFIAYNNLGVALEGQGKFAEAVEQYQAALRVAPNYFEVNQNLAMVLVLQGRAAEAIPCFSTALEKKPDYAAAHAGLGLAFASLGQFAAAEASFREALRLNPAMAMAHAGLGAAQLNQGKAAAAAASFREALRLEPDSNESHDGLGAAFAQLGRLDEAEKELRRALQLKDTAITRNNLANVMVLQKKPAEAVTHFRAAVKLDPAWPTPVNGLARLLATSDDPAVRNGANAIQLAQLACELTGSADPVALDTLAVAYSQSGRFAEAASTAQKAAALAASAGQSELARQIQERLQRYRNNQPAQ